MTHAELLLRYCPWVPAMQAFLGQKEIPGPQTAGFIANWLRRLGTPWSDDETPWCGTAMAGVMESLGLPYPKAYYRARAWVGWGRHIANGKDAVAKLRRDIPYGAIMVLDRPPSPKDGHVGIYMGTVEHSNGPAIALLAGNQGNAVSIATFPLSRVIYAGWPPGREMPFDVGRFLVAKALGLAGTGYMPLASTGEA